MARIHVDNDSNIAGLKPLVGKRNRKNDPVMFLNHYCDYSNGWAVISRGKSVPASTIQTDRITGERPSGQGRGPYKTRAGAPDQLIARATFRLARPVSRQVIASWASAHGKTRSMDVWLSHIPRWSP